MLNVSLITWLQVFPISLRVSHQSSLQDPVQQSLCPPCPYPFSLALDHSAPASLGSSVLSQTRHLPARLLPQCVSLWNMLPSVPDTTPQLPPFSKLLQLLYIKQPRQETWVWSLGREDALEKNMAIHSSILAWEIRWTEERGGLQSMGSQKCWTRLSNWTATNQGTLSRLLVLLYFSLRST